MKSLWVAGCCSHEITGVMHLLKEANIAAQTFSSGLRFCAGDTLILCFSSAPLLGGWRYLRIIQWVASRYDIRLIVLCSDEVYRSGVVCGSNVVALNGVCGCFQLSLLLQQAVQCCLPGIENDIQTYSMWSSFWEEASQVLSISPASEPDRAAALKAYRRREGMVQRLGFVPLIKLQVFMAGFAKQSSSAMS